MVHSQPVARAVPSLDPVWERIRREAGDVIAQDPSLGGFMYGAVLNHRRLEDALAHRLARRLGNEDLGAELVVQAFEDALEAEPDIGAQARADIIAVMERDPACDRAIEPLLYFKGFQALQTYRVAHRLWEAGRTDFALYLQSRASAVFSVDIHPAARVGRGIMIDHAHSIVIGETAVVEDNVSMLHSVTLGGTGKEDGDRHPKVRHGVLLGAGAKVLGNIEIGHCSRVAAGSVVLHDVPANRTVAGVPARIIGYAGCSEPALTMNQQFDGNAAGE